MLPDFPVFVNRGKISGAALTGRTFSLARAEWPLPGRHLQRLNGA
jgi:hypothetical protein